MAVGRRQGRIVAALARAAAPLRLPAAAGAASAVPYCERPRPRPRPRPEILYSQLGLLESALVDEQGRLFVTSQSWDGPTHGAVLRIDRPGAQPVAIARAINSPGGLALDAHGRLIVGFGDSPQGGPASANMVGRAGLLLIDRDSGEREPWVSGLGMANGVARAADGSVFASNDVGAPSSGSTLPAASSAAGPSCGRPTGWPSTPPAASCTPPRPSPAPRSRGSNSPTHVTSQPTRRRLAGARRDARRNHDRPRRPALSSKSLPRRRPDLARRHRRHDLRARPRLTFPSAVALGRGADGFSAGNLYAVTFSGDIVTLPTQRADRGWPSIGAEMRAFGSWKSGTGA